VLPSRSALAATANVTFVHLFYGEIVICVPTLSVCS